MKRQGGDIPGSCRFEAQFDLYRVNVNVFTVIAHIMRNSVKHLCSFRVVETIESAYKVPGYTAYTVERLTFIAV